MTEISILLWFRKFPFDWSLCRFFRNVRFFFFSPHTNVFCKVIFHFSFTPGGYLSVDGMCSGWAGRMVMGLTEMVFEGGADVFSQKLETLCANIQCLICWPFWGHTVLKKCHYLLFACWIKKHTEKVPVSKTQGILHILKAGRKKKVKQALWALKNIIHVLTIITG